MTEGELVASVMEGPGTPTDSKKFICIGCGEVYNMEIPTKPYGVYGTVLLFNEHGVGAPVAIYGHEKAKCVGSPILKALRGESSDAPETPESADEGETVSVSTLRGRRGKPTGLEATSGRPISEEHREEAASAVAAGLE